jgi:two-component system chemotaxis sensor kinase CheA
MSDEILQEFLMESREGLDLLDRELVALEREPRNRGRLASIFRTVHTIKGTAGFFQFGKLEAVAHAGENLLSRLRDNLIVLNTVRTSALLAMVDALRGLLSRIEASEAEGDGDYQQLIEALSLVCSDETLEQGGIVLRGGEAKVAPPSAERPAHGDALARPARASSPPVPALAEVAEKAAIAAATELLAAMSAQPPLAEQTAQLAAPRAESAAEDDDGSDLRDAALDERAPNDGRIRVDVKLLDRLMNLVGELVLTRNQLLQHASRATDGGLVGACQRLNLVTSELQRGVMKTRLQPIENVWKRLPRVVRDLAQLCGKSVRLELEGGNTELDKTIIEAIVDPLTHIVRNAVDHGLETPEQRSAAGKPTMGTLRLHAYHEGGRVNIEVSDDGRGLDLARVKARAIERGLISEQRARSLRLDELHGLLFLPGFSTVATVTNISGRGVGLDVVKSNIERLGGSVDLDSRAGHGTTLRIRIPLTLAIIPALVVGARGELFAIPQVNLVELLRVDADQVHNVIERIHGVPVYRLRGQLLALVELGSLLELDQPTAMGDVNVVVLQADDRRFGLLVDRIHDTEEIVVKPLGRELKGLGTYAGATIMGDGKVALILDVVGLADRAGITSAEPPVGHESASDLMREPALSEQLLVFRAGTSSRMAIPLAAVARLEEFPRSRIEQVGGADVIQYRGDILPLVYVSEVFGEPSVVRDNVQVLVHTGGARHVGFVVGAIEDVIEQEIGATRRTGRPGTLGSAVIQGRVTEILDAAAVRGLVGG